MTARHQRKRRPFRQRIGKIIKPLYMRLMYPILSKLLNAMQFTLTYPRRGWRMTLSAGRYLLRKLHRQPPTVHPPYPITEEFRQYLQRQQKKLESDGLALTTEANETNRSLLNQLFVAGGGILTLSTPILIQQKDLQAIPLYIRTLLAEIIVMAVLSLGFGFAQLFIERRFFEKNKESSSVIVKAIAQGQVRDKWHLAALFAEHQRFPARSSDVFAVLQFIALTFAAIGFVYAMGYILITAN